MQGRDDGGSDESGRGIARVYPCLEEGERAEERENCHGKLTEEMIPKRSWEN